MNSRSDGPTDPALDVALLGQAFAEVVAEADWVIVDYSARGRKRQSIPYYRRRLMALVAKRYAALLVPDTETDR